MEVIKRDGRVVPFDGQRIVNAISKCGDIDQDTKDRIVEVVQNLDRNDISVEEIQDIVERELMASSYKDEAKSYILYRNFRSRERDRKSILVERVKKRIDAKTVENSNANVDERSFSGKEKEASSDIGKAMAIDFGGLSDEVAQAHKDMLCYQHDLEKAVYGVHNCLNVNFQELFKHGFRTRNGDVRPPRSVDTAYQQVAVSFQCQSQVQFGGVGTIHLDYDLAPFVKISFYKYFSKGMRYFYGMSKADSKKLVKTLEGKNYSIDNPYFKDYPKAYDFAMENLEEEGAQAAQGLYHNLNTLESRQGSQVPFTSINFGRDTSPEGRMVSRDVLNASIDGIGKYHQTSIFPISIFQYKKGINAKPGDPNYDLKRLALKSLSKRIYPNWVNCDCSNAHETPGDIDTYFATMGCRTMIGKDRHGLGYKRQGRGNNTPVTIVLPKIGIMNGICLGERIEPDLDGFWKDLDEALRIAEQGLLERYAIMAKQSPKAAPFMYQNNTIQCADKCKETVEESLKHNTLGFGYVGVAEMCQALFGKNHAEDTNVRAFALSVVKHIREWADEASDRNDLNMVCYATPAEGLCHTAVKALREQYGVIENVTSREYLTNSHHVPVWQKVSIHEKLEIEAPFCKYPSGGCITYVELPSSFMKNLDAIEDIIDYAFDVLDIPYLAFNFPIDTCLDCGHQGEFGEHCTECGSTHIQRLRRVTGYLTTDYRNFNLGKQKETDDRVRHTKEIIILGEEP